MFLIVVGAILYWATDFELASVDMNVVGLILLIAGVVALIFSIGTGLVNRKDRERGTGPPRY